MCCLRVWPVTSANYDIVILCFAHGSITTRGEWSWYDVDFWPQGQIHRVYDMALCSGHSFFVLWHSHIMSVSSWYYVSHTFMTSVWPWPWPLTSISKVYIFSMNLTWQDPLCSLTKAYQFWYLGVLPGDNMLCTFLTFVWPWPLIYMGWLGYPKWVLLIVFILFSQTAEVHGQLVPNRKRWKWKDKLKSRTTTTTKMALMSYLQKSMLLKYCLQKSIHISRYKY